MASNATTAAAPIAANLDAIISEFFSTWSATSTVLLITLLTALIYPLITAKDPDVHPFILARQATPSAIRFPGASAVYRALDVPHSYPLRSGLGIKDINSPKWSPGRKGDLRDILLQAVRGPEDQAVVGGFDASKTGKVLTLLGREKVLETSFGQVTEQVNALGWWLKNEAGVSRVAVYLPNSVELLVLIFAAAFYDFSVVLIPPGTADQEDVNKLLVQAQADALVTEAGGFNLDSVLSEKESTPAVKTVLIVAKGGSEHMNFTQIPDSESSASASASAIGKGEKLVMWHTAVDLAKAQGKATDQVLPVDTSSGSGVKPLFTFVPNGEDGSHQLVEFTSDNLIAGISGLNALVARGQKIGPTDTLLATTSLTDPYTLSWVLSAIFGNASIALNSVAGESVNLDVAVPPTVSPTILVTSATTIKQFLPTAINSGLRPTGFKRLVLGNSLAAGIMPVKPQPQPQPQPSQSTKSAHPLSQVRLVLIGQPIWQHKTRLTSDEVHELRLTLATRVGYALTAPEVAGAIAQTNIHDYRNKGDLVSVGPPLGSVEIHVVGEEKVVGSSTPEGKIAVRGPAVAGERVELNGRARIAEDNTVSLV